MLSWLVNIPARSLERRKMIRKCSNCEREEDHEGQFDCEDWSEDQAVILCDDCFFNDLYKKGESNGKL